LPHRSEPGCQTFPQLIRMEPTFWHWCQRICMELWRKKLAKRWVSILGMFVVTVALIPSMKYLVTTNLSSLTLPFSPKPPLLAESNHFSCLESPPGLKGEKRFAVLRGPDWKIESVINANCLPERESSFSMEEGRQFLPRPIVRRVTFWVTKVDDLIYVKIWHTTNSDRTDATALDLLTNHKCKKSGTKNCRVQSTWRNLPRPYAN